MYRIKISETPKVTIATEYNIGATGFVIQYNFANSISDPVLATWTGVVDGEVK